MRRRALLLAGAVVIGSAAGAALLLRRPAPAVDVRSGAPARSDSDTAACARFAAALPDDLGGLGRRRTTSGTPVGFAAYGDPPVVVRCGVPVRTKFRTGDQLIVINGVAWDVDELADERLRCSVPRSVVNVEVEFPAGYTAERLALLATAVQQAQPF